MSMIIKAKTLVMITALFIIHVSGVDYISIGHASDVEHIVWDKSPIQIVLPVGQERRIDFPVPIHLEMPRALKDASKPIQIREDGSVYWTATKPFEKTRVKALTHTGYSYFLDVSAKKNGHSHHVVIVDNRISKADEDAQSLNIARQYNYDYVDLARFAAQSVYAPLRLIKALPGVVQVGVENEEVPLYRGRDLITEPMAQWKSPTVPAFYVTAVRVTSNALGAIVFDPRLLRGDWLTATAQHAVVNPVGKDGSTTTWYLISKAPFNEMLSPVSASTSLSTSTVSP
jgi:integrating conjugative element protein (TIGR03749 family)